MRRLFALLLLAGLIVCAAFVPQREAQQQDKPARPEFDLDQYQFGLLKRGPNWTAEKTPELQKIQEGHMANINKMAKAGKLMAAGPIMDNSDLRGIFIFKAASLEEARTLADEDPAIKSGRLTLELLTWRGIRGVGAKLQETLKTDPNPKYTMTKYHLVLLKDAPDRVGEKPPEDLVLGHLTHIRRMLDSNKMVTAGPFDNERGLRGLYVLATESADEAKTWADSDPAIKAGRLTSEIHPWLCAKEVWP